MKCTQLEVKNYLRGRLGASFKDNSSRRRPGGGVEVDGGDGSPGAWERRRREKERRQRGERKGCAV
jgi:hypothetical protein